MTSVIPTAIDPELLAKAKTALSKAKIGLMARPDMVFYITIVFSLKYEWCMSTRTASVDGVTMRINPEFWLKQTPEVRIFVLYHEASHVALMHMCRLMGRVHSDFNIAADHVINLMAKKAGFRVPNWVYADDQYIGMDTETVYNLIHQNPNPPPPLPPPPGTGGQIPPGASSPGQGATQPGQGMDGDLLPMPGSGKEEREATQRAIEDILVRAKVQSKMADDKPGCIPGEVEIFLERLLNPKLPWNVILQKYMLKFAKSDYSFRKPNRRFFPQYHLPSLFSTALIDMAIAVDTSGSVTDGEFLQFISETASAMRMMKPKNITLVQFDTEIKSVDQIPDLYALSKVRFTGRGGTEINPVLNWANENKPQLLLVFTDGGFYFYTLQTKVPVLWLIHNDKSKQFNPPFGTTIHYTV